MVQVRRAALETVYPETGFAPEDPRLTPVGMPLVAFAVAADHWTPMLRADMEVATLYGQLSANIGDLAVRPA